MYTVYILICDEGRYYIGVTEDIDRRLREHNNPNGKKSRFTKRYTNWKTIYTEHFDDFAVARKREAEIKSWKGGNTFKSLITPE